MSKDVHLAKVTKIHRSANVSKGSLNNHRYIEHTAKETHPFAVAVDMDLFFGHTSPRGRATQHQLREMESPDQIQRDTNESDNNISSCSTLDIVNKVENLSLHQLETQVCELTQRLQHAEKQRSEMQLQLEECKAERDLCFRRLEIVSAAHECRITEMHCVIAELSKKLRAKQENTILEEQESDVSEISYQDGSVCNSEMNLTNPDAGCQTDPLDGNEFSAGNGVNEELKHDVTHNIKLNDAALNKGQVEAMQEEILHLKAQIALLQSEIANSIRVDKEYFSAEPNDNNSNSSVEQFQYSKKDEIKLNDLNAKQADHHSENLPSPQKVLPQTPKMAERVKIRCASKLVPESEIINADTVEHLVSDLQQDNGLMDSFVGSDHSDNELQRLQRKVEHLKVRNDVISITLDECKEHCEHLYLLCGKYESNAIALQSAVNCSDRAIEAYDVMLALLESKLALMKDKSAAAEDSRRAVESVARHLLDRLESEKNICENSLGPWQNTFNIPDKSPRAPWTSDDDSRLRCHVSKLKGRRSTVQNTIVNLESPFSDFHEKSRIALERNKELHNEEKPAQLDLEMAILMQELLNLREENISLKAKVAKVDREQRVSFSGSDHAALTELQLIESMSRESELKSRIHKLIASVSAVAASQKNSDEKYEQLQANVRELQKSNLSLAQLLDQTKRKYQMKIRKLEQKIMEMNLELGLQTSTGDAGRPVQQSKCDKSKYTKLSTSSSFLYHDVPETTL